MLKIKQLRIKRKMRQADLAKALNVGRATIADWERGASYPRTSMLPAVAKTLKCKIDDLFT